MIKIVLISFLISLFISFVIALIKEKTSGNIFEFSDLNKRINCSFLDTLYLSQRSLGKFILDNLLSKYLKDKKKDGKIGIINIFSNFYNSEIQNYVENNDNYINAELTNQNILESCNYIILIISSDKKSKKEINTINQYLKIYDKRVIGWFYLNSNDYI